MGLSVSVCLVRGIDYGKRSRKADARAAWKWYDDAEDNAGDGCEAFTPNDGDERASHLVVFAQVSHVDLSVGGRGDEPSPVVDVMGHIASIDTTATDVPLRAFCAARGLPWREPRWLLLTDQS